MASKQAKSCVSREIKRHCHKKRGKCKRESERKQAVAIAFSMCRRRGFRSIAKR